MRSTAGQGGGMGKAINKGRREASRERKNKIKQAPGHASQIAPYSQYSALLLNRVLGGKK
jgi:hypothetical protein